ncbi:MAG: DUF4345 family protein [Anaerolineae bacterium]|nr:DUF4345 family protein [Anaerolineae bacterium]
MPLEQFFNLVACIAIILFGIYALLRPYEVAAMAHLKADDSNGTAEVRISFGGLFVMMGIAPLVLNDPVAYQVVGLAFIGAFVTRLITLVVDHPQTDRLFVISGLFEVVVGLVLLFR